jgi:hypothetical protein
MPLLKKRKEEIKNQPPPSVDGPAIMAPVKDPMLGSRECAAAVGQLIGGAAEVSGNSVGFRITPLLSGVTISWERRTLPSRQWLRDLEQEIIAFGICNGLQVWFREH